MSRSELLEAFELIRANEELADFDGEKDEALIQKAEYALSLSSRPPIGNSWEG